MFGIVSPVAMMIFAFIASVGLLTATYFFLRFVQNLRLDAKNAPLGDAQAKEIKALGANHVPAE
ncbi:MAG: hypothetical protein AAF850_03575 [Pseudomonadota bacterium]